MRLTPITQLQKLRKGSDFAYLAAYLAVHLAAVVGSTAVAVAAADLGTLAEVDRSSWGFASLVVNRVGRIRSVVAGTQTLAVDLPAEPFEVHSRVRWTWITINWVHIAFLCGVSSPTHSPVPAPSATSCLLS